MKVRMVRVCEGKDGEGCEGKDGEGFVKVRRVRVL